MRRGEGRIPTTHLLKIAQPAAGAELQILICTCTVQYVRSEWHNFFFISA